MITLPEVLLLGTLLFCISVAGIFLNRKNVLILLMCIELMLLSVNINFIAFSHFLGDIHGRTCPLGPASSSSPTRSSPRSSSSRPARRRPPGSALHSQPHRCATLFGVVVDSPALLAPVVGSSCRRQSSWLNTKRCCRSAARCRAIPSQPIRLWPSRRTWG